MTAERPAQQSQTSGSEAAEVVYHRRLLTIPNMLCFIRMAGSLVLIALAFLEQPRTFVYLFVFLTMTDWVDGKLAILLDQRSIFGARLDSAADAALYSALMVGLLVLKLDVMRQEMLWIVVAALSYGLSTGVGIWKFRRVPSYHTRAAKTSWLLMTIGALSVLGGWATWPFRLALFAVTLTNVETTAISVVLREPQVDVTSLYHAWRRPSGTDATRRDSV